MAFFWSKIIIIICSNLRYVLELMDRSKQVQDMDMYYDASLRFEATDWLCLQATIMIMSSKTLAMICLFYLNKYFIRDQCLQR